MRSERNATAGDSTGSSIDGAAHAIRSSARAATKASSVARQRLTTWRQTIVREAKERPARTAAIALGAGYLLGGGLFSSLTARIVSTGIRIGIRLAIIPLLTQSVASMGDGLFGGMGEDEAETEDSNHGRSEGRNGRRHSSETKEKNS